MHNVGFRQYKLPNDVALNQHIEINDKSYLEDGSKLQYMIDDNETSVCKLSKTNTKQLKDAQIIIFFEKEYKCNSVQIIFKNDVKKVKIYDYSNNEKGSIILEQDKVTKKTKQVLNKSLSAILITGLSIADNEDDVQIQSINVFSNEIIPPVGYYFKDIEIHSKEED